MLQPVILQWCHLYKTNIVAVTVPLHAVQKFLHQNIVMVHLHNYVLIWFWPAVINSHAYTDDEMTHTNLATGNDVILYCV